LHENNFSLMNVSTVKSVLDKIMRPFFVLCVLMLFGNAVVLPVHAQECLPTRLTIGDEAQVTPGAANRIRSQATTSAEQVGQIPAGEVMTLLDGPQCAESFLWWRIRYDGIEGWTVEANATDYFIEPYADATVATATDTDESCKVETRLQVGDYGKVSSNTPSRLRGEPGVTGDQVGQVDPLDVFQVIAGSTCAGGFNWWQVEVNGLVGWLAEGDSENYYVEVVTDPDIIGSFTTPEPPSIAHALSWNADGSRIAVATSNGVFIYNPADWDEPPYLLDDGIVATSLAFSPTDSDLLVINGTDDTLFRFRAYRLSDEGDEIVFEGVLMDGPMGGDLPAYDLAFSADGSKLGFGGRSYDVVDTDSWEQRTFLDIEEEAGNHYARLAILSSDLNATGDYGAGAIREGIVYLFDLTISHSSSFGIDDPRISTLDRGGRTQDITDLKFSPDGLRLIVGDNTGSLQMWDLETGNRTSFIRADTQTSISNRINDIAFHPDGDIVATAESDPAGIVRIFDTEDLTQLTVFGANESHTSATVVAYSPDGSLLLMVMDDTMYALDTIDYSVVTQVEIP